MSDVSYFLGTGLTVDDRRAHEEELVRGYHQGLLDQGVQSLSWDECWEGYRRGVFNGLLLNVAAGIVVVQTERGDRMFEACFTRMCQQVLDLGALELLPDPDAAAPEPLQPAPEDEGTHPPGPEPLWNESWYFDGVSDDGSLGVYTRTGRVPNQDACLYTTCICGPGRPTIMLTEASAPLPDIDDPAQAIHVDGLDAEQHCDEPLRRFRVAMQGTGQAYDDPAAILRGEAGRDVAIALDLTFETAASPTSGASPPATRSRAGSPARVTVDGEQIEFAGPGQRDHSWGARDWWGSDWMWSALHLEDGTHTHAVGVPQMPGFGVGYVQRGDELAEIGSVSLDQQVADDGLVTADTIASGPEPELELAVQPLAYGPILLEAPDGRVTHFVRAMCA